MIIERWMLEFYDMSSNGHIVECNLINTAGWGIILAEITLQYGSRNVPFSLLQCDLGSTWGLPVCIVDEMPFNDVTV